MNEPTGPLKIGFAIASRGRPSALIGVIAAAWRLQSGRNHMAFTVAVDDDDILTTQAMHLMAQDGEMPVTPTRAERPPYMAAAQNRAIEAAMGADLVCLLSDRTFLITPGYDQAIVDAAVKYPNRILWISSPGDPDTTVPIIPHTILDIMGWKPLPEIFPFWFSDTWLMEVDRMCFGGPSLRIRPMYSGARKQTTSGRDFEFWTKVFIATRPARMAEAQKWSSALGLTWRDPPPEMLDDFHSRDRHLLAHADEFQAAFGDKREASPQYVEAKAKAEKLLEGLS